MTTRGAATALVGAAHPGPTVAVTVLAGLLAVSLDQPISTSALLVAAVLAGQLSIGWSNDLLDAPRDLAVGRDDKPLATGAVSVVVVRAACAAALVATAALSLLCGLVAGLVQLLVVASGWVYNLGAKSTAWSWLPYAVAFGALPVFVSLADPLGPWSRGTAGDLPPAWMPVAGALLGVGAHLVNVLPDLADDAATGVRGLPHRIGARWTPVLAVVVLALATAVIVVGAPDVPLPLLVSSLAAVGVLAGIALVGRGDTPFRAAVGIAVVDVVMLVVSR